MGRRVRVAVVVGAFALLVASCSGNGDAADEPTTSSSTTTTTPVPAEDQTAAVGTNGLTFDTDGYLWVADLDGFQVLKVDPADGTILARFGAAEGVNAADDVVLGPDGAIYFTDLPGGDVGRIDPDGTVEVIAELPAPGPNPLAFSEDGRLFVGLNDIATGADALYEVDPDGGEEPRLVAEDLGQVNAFAFGPDGFLYGPRFGLGEAGTLVRIDPDSGEVTEVTAGFGYPVSVRFAEDGTLYLAQAVPPMVFTVDPETGETTPVGTPETAVIDNFAIASDGSLYVSSFDQPTVTVLSPGGEILDTVTVGTAE